MPAHCSKFSENGELVSRNNVPSLNWQQSATSRHWALDKLSLTGDAARNGQKAYGLLAYDTTNIGDDIQALAALQFMPRVDLLINRDTIGEQGSTHSFAEASVSVIMNGWFMGRRSWPPATCIRPIFTSFHASQESYENYGFYLL